MVGYPFVLPDMIGGNYYEANFTGPKSKELFIRWLQASVFTPTLQFSYAPWDFDEETTILSKKMTSLHTAYAPKIIERFKLAVRAGHPVNPPVWWIATQDRTAQQIDDRNEHICEKSVHGRKLIVLMRLQSSCWGMTFLSLRYCWKDIQLETFICRKGSGLTKTAERYIEVQCG